MNLEKVSMNADLNCGHLKGDLKGAGKRNSVRTCALSKEGVAGGVPNGTERRGDKMEQFAGPLCSRKVPSSQGFVPRLRSTDQSVRYKVARGGSMHWAVLYKPIFSRP